MWGVKIGKEKCNQVSCSDHDTIIELKTLMTESNKDIKEIKKKLFGNGDEGICATIITHRTYFKIIGVALTILSTAVLAKIFLPL